MINNYKVITCNHLIADVSKLANYMLPTDEEGDGLKSFKTSIQAEELIYLSTCNRVAYILYYKGEVNDAMLSNMCSLINPDQDEDQFVSHLGVYEGIEAVRHIMEVAGSIDSMVVGEREIFRQFREAYNTSLQLGISGDKLRILENAIVENTKSILTNTRIGEKPLSIASLAVVQALQNITQQDLSILLIGAGETNSLIAKLLKPKKLGKYHVINRSESSAKRLASFLDGTYSLLREVSTKSHNTFDIIFVCTAAQKAILDRTMYDQIGIAQNNVVVIDLSIPQNVSQDVADLPNVHYISIKSLEELAALNLEHRKNEIVLAKQIITQAIQKFPKRFQERQIELALSSVPTEVKSVKDKAINSVYKARLDGLPTESQELIKEMMDYMEKKCISIPMKVAKKNLLK